jgi:hypothetical protein
MQSKILFAVAAFAMALSAASAVEAAKAKPKKHAGHQKAHTMKGWKKCSGTNMYLKGGKCMDARDKKTKS